jgi:alpha-glucosidase
MKRAWWKHGVIYQVYPRSFQDSDGDGVGDLAGVAARLEYLAWLGVDAVWLSPFYPSPMVDFGYDVADYCGVDPIFGTLADFDALLAKAHALDLKVLLDLVPNHTSDQHPWFIESRSGRESGKRDWYIWRDPAPGGGPPNNWISDFGGPAWEFDAASGQHYSHAFLPQQPDLNWRNPEVRAAMWDAMRFWLDRGVDGFRVDVMWHMIKHRDFADNPVNSAWRPEMGEMHKVLQTNSTDQDEVHEVVAEMRGVLDAYKDRVMLGEIYLPVDRLVRYYGNGKGAQLPLNFHLIETEWSAAAIGELIKTYEAALPKDAWPNWVLGNHDRPRIATRVGQARLAAMLLLTLRGTPTLYYGDELGLTDAPIPPGAARDPRELREMGLGLGRDPVRTPMPWDDRVGAGFTTGTPWLPMPGAHAALNVEALECDERSVLNLYRALLALRRETAALSEGDVSVRSIDGNVLIYDRREGRNAFRIALNFGRPVKAPALLQHCRVLVSTEMDHAGRAPISLRAGEGVVCEVGQP